MRDPELKLQSALRAFVDDLYFKLYARLSKGEEEHQGSWRTKTIAALEKDIEEEILDILMYQMFIELHREMDEEATTAS